MKMDASLQQQTANQLAIPGKPKKVKAITVLLEGKDVLRILPNGYGKSVISGAFPIVICMKDPECKP